MIRNMIRESKDLSLSFADEKYDTFTTLGDDLT